MSDLPPRPVPDGDTQPYWDAVARRCLVVPRCSACGRWIWQPRPVCPACGAWDPVWTEVTGAGGVVSWTVIHPPVLPVWADQTPFTVVLVQLEEGVRMVGRLVDATAGAGAGDGHLHIGAPVELRWRTDAGLTLPAWTLTA